MSGECEHDATFDAVLVCPTCMQAIRAGSPEVDALMRSIEEYRNAPSGTASAPLPDQITACGQYRDVVVPLETALHAMMLQRDEALSELAAAQARVAELEAAIREYLTANQPVGAQHRVLWLALDGAGDAARPQPEATP